MTILSTHRLTFNPFLSTSFPHSLTHFLPPFLSNYLLPSLTHSLLHSLTSTLSSSSCHHHTHTLSFLSLPHPHSHLLLVTTTPTPFLFKVVTFLSMFVPLPLLHVTQYLSYDPNVNPILKYKNRYIPIANEPEGKEGRKERNISR